MVRKEMNENNDDNNSSLADCNAWQSTFLLTVTAMT